MRCKALPGKDLFQYLNEAGHAQPIHGGMVNDNIRSISSG